MKKIEGTYHCHDGVVAIQASVWDIVTDSEDKKIRNLIKRISKRSKNPNFDLPAMFANRDFHFSKFIFDGEAEEVVDGIIREMYGSWVRFTKTGEPGDAWPRYAGYDCEIRIFDRETRTERVDHTALMAAWGDMRFYEN